MSVSNSLAVFRQLLAQPPSWELWSQLIEELDRGESAPGRALALDLFHAHLASDWPVRVRQGNHRWGQRSCGWELCQREQRPLPGVPEGEEVWCPPSQQWIGTAEEAEVIRSLPESPRVLARLTYGYWMQTTSVTQAQWRAVMGTNPSHFQGDERRPVEGVSWYDAVMFCNKLSREAGLTPAYQLEDLRGAPGLADGSFSANVRWTDLSTSGYRLPTELEWELSCRAGSLALRYEPLDRCAWFEQNSGGQTLPVGKKRPNAWGLYDMLGNVYDWCWDSVGSYDATERWVDPFTATPNERVYRGGNFASPATYCRAAYRVRSEPRARFSGVGFRVCRTAT